MRMFGFDSVEGVRRRLQDFQGSNTTVMLSNCEVKCSRKGEQLEIFLCKDTQVEVSAKRFDVSSISNMKYGKAITLDQLPDLAQFQRVNVAVKALHVDDHIEVTGGKRKQDILVGDSTRTARLTLWENEIWSMKENNSYKLNGMVVCEYCGVRFLSTSRENSHIVEVDDIGSIHTEEEEVPLNSNTSTIKNAHIIGVLDIDTYNSCLKCSSKIMPDTDDDELDECVKCKMMQCIAITPKQLSI